MFIGSRIYKLFEDGVYYEGFVQATADYPAVWQDPDVENNRVQFHIFYPIDQGTEDLHFDDLLEVMTTLGPSQAQNKAGPSAKKSRRSSVPTDVAEPVAKRRRRTQGRRNDDNDDDEEEEEVEEMVENDNPDADDDNPDADDDNPDADDDNPRHAATSSRGTNLLPKASDKVEREEGGGGRGSRGGGRGGGRGKGRGRGGGPASLPFDIPDHEPATEGLRTEGTAGHLVSIRLEDFMCHRLFEMEFGPHVTLVSGDNGSGKSAVMQGLQACLGVNARATGRATNLQSFIRTGSDVARVKVTLSNTGEDAFERGRLGSRISLEKKLSRGTGGATWKVYDERGRVVNDIKPKAVLEHLGVNAANPLTIVTQDGVRSFFSGDLADRKRKYTMFMEGTLLEHIRCDLADSSSTVKRTEDLLRGTKSTLKAKKSELKEIKDRIEKLKGVDDLSSSIEAMSKCLSWVCVWQAREDLEEMKGGSEEGDMEERVAKVQERCRAASEAVERAAREEKELVEEMNASNAHVTAASADQARLNSEHQKLNTARRRIEMEVKRLEGTLQDHEASKKELEKVRAEDLTEKAKERLMVIEKVERAVNQAREAMRSAEEAFDSRRSATLVAKSEKDRLLHVRDQAFRDGGNCEKQVDSYRRQLNEIRTAQSDKAASFAPARSQQAGCVRKLLDLIERNKGNFDRMPLGPVGLFLGLKDSRWSIAIESSLGNLMDQFLVHSMKDSELLRKLSRDAGYGTFTTTRVNFDNPLYDVSRNKPKSGAPCIMDVLVCSSPNASSSPGDKAKAEATVLRFLIDRAKIESNALYEDAMDARDAVYGNSHKGISRGLDRSAYSMDGQNFAVMGANTVMQKGYQGRRAPRIGLDTAQQVSQLQEALEASEVQLRAARDRFSSIRSEEGDADRKLALACRAEDEAGRVKKNAKMAYDGAMREVQRVQDEHRHQSQARARGGGSRGAAGPSQGPNPQGDAEDAEDEIATQVDKVRGEILATQVEIDDHRSRLQAAMAKEKKAKELLEQHKELIALSFQTVEASDKKVQQAVALRAKAQAALAREKQRLDTIRSEMAARQAEIHAKTAEVAELAKIASEQTPDESEAKSALVNVRSYFTNYVGGMVEERRRTGYAPVPKFKDEEEMRKFVQEKVDERCTADHMSKEIERIERKIKSAENEAGGDKDELEHQFNKLSKEVMKIDIKFKAGLEIFMAMDSSLRSRQQSFTRLKEQIVNITSNDFLRYMKRRQHLGRVDVDDESGELTIEVKVKGVVDKHAKSVRDLKQLSGGERSYTATSYLLAVGKHTESPFRCMDEYDVFMDPINRRVATETLLEFAHDHPDKQYVFLTPQDIQMVEDARKELVTKKRTLQEDGQEPFDLPESFLKVVRLHAARGAARGQQTQGA